MLAHVDVNSVYKSFERVFNPSLEGRPPVLACARLSRVHSETHAELHELGEVDVRSHIGYFAAERTVTVPGTEAG